MLQFLLLRRREMVVRFRPGLLREMCPCCGYTPRFLIFLSVCVYLTSGCFSIFSRSSMAEQSPVKRRVPGSSPGGRALNPSSSTWIEQAATNRQVTGSNPVWGTGVVTCCGLLPMFCPYGLVGLGYRLLTAEVTGSNPVGGAVGLLKWWFSF